MEHNNLTVKIISNDKFVIYNGNDEVVVKLVVGNGRLYIADNDGKRISTIPTEFMVKSLIDLYQKGSQFIVCIVEFTNDETERYDLDVEDILTIMHGGAHNKPNKEECKHHHDCCNSSMHVDMSKYVTLKDFCKDRNDRLFNENYLQNQIDDINNVAIKKVNRRIDDTNEVLEGNVYKTDLVNKNLCELDKHVRETERKNDETFKCIGDNIRNINNDVKNILDEQSKFETKENAKATYATKEEVEEGYQPKGDYLTEHQDLSEYAKIEYVDESVTDMATMTWVEEQGYITEYQSLDDYATKEDVENEVKSAIDGLVDGASDAMNTLKELEDAINENKDVLTTFTTKEELNAVNDSVVRLDNYVNNGGIFVKNEDAINEDSQLIHNLDTRYIREHQDLSNYVTTSSLQTIIDGLENKINQLETRIAELENNSTTPQPSQTEEFVLTSADQINSANVLISFDINGGNNSPAWYSPSVRFYQNNKIVFTTKNNKKISKIKFNFEADKYALNPTSKKSYANTGELSSDSGLIVDMWIGDANIVEIVPTTGTGESNQVRIKSFEITYIG